MWVVRGTDRKLLRMPLLRLSGNEEQFVLGMLSTQRLRDKLGRLRSDLCSLRRRVEGVTHSMRKVASLRSSFQKRKTTTVRTFFHRYRSPFLLFFRNFLTSCRGALGEVTASLRVLRPTDGKFVHRDFLSKRTTRNLMGARSVAADLARRAGTIVRGISSVIDLPRLRSKRFSTRMEETRLRQEGCH